MQIIKQAKNYLNNSLLAGIVFAEETGTINISPQGEFAGLETVNSTSLVSAGIKIVLIVAALVALFFLIFGGIKWITSGGDKGHVESARNTVTAALIGLLIVFAAWALIQLISYFFGINILEFKLPDFKTG